MLIIDPIGNHIGATNTDKDGDVRHAIAPLNGLADELGCLIIGVRHPGKNRMGGAVASVLGSTAWVDVPRAVVFIAKDDEDEDLRHIQVVAGNRARNGSAQMFRIEGVKVEGVDGEITVARELGESSKQVDDLLVGEPGKGGEGKRSRSAEAAEMILDILEDEGEQESDELDERVAQAAGLRESTVRQIRKKLTAEGLVKSMPDKDESGSVVRWKVYRKSLERP